MQIRNKRSLEQIRLLISSGSVEDAADSLLLIVRNQNLRNQIYLFLRDWSDTKSKYNNGVLDYSEYKIHTNRVVFGLLEEILPHLEEIKASEQAQQLMSAGFDKFENEDFEGALVDFESVLHLFPGDTEALLQRGIIRNRLGRHKEAKSDFDEVIKKERYNAHAFVCRGSLFMSLGEKTQACADWEEAAEYAFEPALKETITELLHQYSSHKIS